MLAIVLAIVGFGVVQHSILLGAATWALAGGCMHVSQRYPWTEERFWGLFWLFGVVSVPVTWVALYLGY